MTDQNIKTSLGEDGVLLATIDMPGRSMNVFSFELMDSIDWLITHANGDDRIKAVVINSAKKAFIAGADLVMVRMFTERAQTDSHADLVGLCGRLGRIFRRLEKSRKPFVAAVDGLALGGGLELCLACHARVASDRKGVLLGLPEIKLGLLPGAGGTQRLPRVVGARLGLDMLLIGNPVTADVALECGLVDAVVPSAELLNAARAKALSLGSTVKSWDQPDACFHSGELRLGEAGAHVRVADVLGLSDEQINHYPAYRAIMDCVIDGWGRPLDAGLDKEMDIFVRLIQNPVAGNMIRGLFIDRQRSLKVLKDVTADDAVSVAADDERAAALLRSTRAPLVSPEALAPGDVLLAIDSAQAHGGSVVVATLGGVVPAGDGLGDRCHSGVWVGPMTEHGRAVEVVFDRDATARDAALRVAAWLRAGAVLVTEGASSQLARLAEVDAAAAATGSEADDRILLVALAAGAMWIAGDVPDVALFDSVCAVAGVVPSYTGGPLNYLRQNDEASLRQRAMALGHAWPEGLSLVFSEHSRGD
ncbi:enoyl-CoA hydratase-related protein [Denitromonas ohlonensis]|nr:enoyl-CoA hydratase-related protein [Denitromonas ohlonensis]